MSIEAERLEAAVRVLYPGYELLDVGEQLVALKYVDKALEASDAVLFADENVARSYPYVYSFLKRRGMVPIGKEVESLVGYVISGVRGDYGVE